MEAGGKENQASTGEAALPSRRGPGLLAKSEYLFSKHWQLSEFPISRVIAIGKVIDPSTEEGSSDGGTGRRTRGILVGAQDGEH